MKTAAIVLGCLVMMVGACGGGGAGTDSGRTDVADSETDGPPAIEPGSGVHVSDIAVTLGARFDDFAGTFGAPSRVLELTAQGERRVEWRADGLIVVRGATGAIAAIELLAPFAGTTADGLGLGSERSAVDALPYAFAHEPFVGASIDRAHGIALVWEADVVERVLIFPATGQ